MTFREALDWARPGGVGSIDPSWFQGRGAFGGLVAALFLRAMGHATDRPARTLTVHFCGPAAGELTLETQVERAGRSVVHQSGRLVGPDGPVALALATFAEGRDSAVALDADPVATLPAWPAGIALPDAPFIPVFARKHFEFRFALGEPLFSGAARAATGGWVKFRDEAPAEAASDAALLDAWPPGVFPVLRGPVTASTVDFTVQFFEAVPGRDVNAPHIFLKTVTQAARGYAEERGTLWTAEGRPVGRIRQLFAVFG